MTHQPNDALVHAPFTAVIKSDGPWWIGWVAEVPGVNGQETTRDALIETLTTALGEALAMNRDEARRAAGTDYIEVGLEP